MNQDPNSPHQIQIDNPDVQDVQLGGGPGAGPNPGGGPITPTAGHCFKCGSPDFRKLSYTWWGGILGPAIFSHVKCNNCGQSFNSKTGKSNTVPIVIYSVVLTVILIIVYAIIGA